MTDLPFKDVDYCKYGMPYRKRTRLWNNVECWEPIQLCQKYCDSMFRREELYKVPESLISEIFASIINRNKIQNNSIWM